MMFNWHLSLFIKFRADKYRVMTDRNAYHAVMRPSGYLLCK